MPGRPRVFISYRRDDTEGAAQAVYDRLAERFGAEQVFLDTRTLTPGMKWLEEIKSHTESCGVFLALMGQRWMPAMAARAQATVADPAEDYVRLEIEYALRRNSGIQVIPVLVGKAVPPMADRLTRSLRPLADLEAARVTYEQFPGDVERLIATIEQVAAATPPPVLIQLKDLEQPTTIAKPVVSAPDLAHHDRVLRHMVEKGDLVPLLGTQMNSSRPHQGRGTFPDAEELAADLAKRFDIQLDPHDLPAVAQHVYVTTGQPDLFKTLKQILTDACEPGPVHRFLAQFPSRLEALGLEKRYQLIVSTTYDMALEKAFDEANEPYDLAVYMASGDDMGRFVHFPYGSEPEAVKVTNNYGKFPIGDDDLERTVIVKVHGAVDGSLGTYRWQGNYVITEDHYIDYLSSSPVESLVPIQILRKLKDSHCLFLGYTMRDWALRVFLKRIWPGGTIESKSWAIERSPDELEKDFWAQSKVELFASDLGDYVERLQERLLARRPVSAGP